MKLVIVLDGELPRGLLANAAAVLAFSVAERLPGCLGGELADAGGGRHSGIINVPIPVLCCEAPRLAELREAAREAGLGCVDFSDAAQSSKTYDEYEKKLASRPASALRYLGVCVYGENGAVKKLTGSLPLL